LGREWTQLALLFLVGFSVWKMEFHSDLALFSGELRRAGHGGATASLLPSDRRATPSLSLIFFF
jgi:hypothetical protein